MTELELQAIRERAEAAAELPFYSAIATDVLDEDVPKLLAEVERLRKELTDITVCIDEYYANDDDDIPPHDLLDCIRDDARQAVKSDD